MRRGWLLQVNLGTTVIRAGRYSAHAGPGRQARPERRAAGAHGGEKTRRRGEGPGSISLPGFSVSSGRARYRSAFTAIGWDGPPLLVSNAPARLGDKGPRPGVGPARDAAAEFVADQTSRRPGRFRAGLCPPQQCGRLAVRQGAHRLTASTGLEPAARRRPAKKQVADSCSVSQVTAGGRCRRAGVSAAKAQGGPGAGGSSMVDPVRGGGSGVADGGQCAPISAFIGPGPWRGVRRP